MRLFLLDWFGWSFLWILPLLGRVLLSLLSGKGLRGRGSIRIWLGTLVVLCASSAIEAMLRSQGDAVLETDLFGQALARNVTLAFGKLIAVIALMTTGLVGLFWLFGRRKAHVTLDADISSLPLQASVPRRTQSNIAPTIRNMPAAQAHRPAPAQPKTPAAAAFGNLTRKRDPWPLPNEMPRAANPAGNWPGTAQPKSEPTKRPARPASEWAAFESLRPTQAMLARSTSSQQPEAPAPAHIAAPKPSLATSLISKPKITPIAGSSTKVRISTASDRSQAIPTSLSASLRAREPAAPVEPAIVPPVAPSLMPVPPPAVPQTVAFHALEPEPEVITAPEPFNVIDTRIEPEVAEIPGHAYSDPTPTPTLLFEEPVREAAVAAVATVPMQIRTWTQAPAAQPAPPIAAPTRPYRPTEVPLPGIELLDQGSDMPVEMDETQLLEIGQLIEQRLKEFKVPVTVLGAGAGPVITRYEVEPATRRARRPDRST
jgi:S-DNA-T family DNA segregation ATPase FtsK/SpoIIIE